MTAKKTKKKYALDEEGKPLPHSPDEIQEHITRIQVGAGKPMFVGAQVGEELAVQFFCPPSVELAEALEAAARAVRYALKREAH